MIKRLSHIFLTLAVSIGLMSTATVASAHYRFAGYGHCYWVKSHCCQGRYVHAHKVCYRVRHMGCKWVSSTCSGYPVHHRTCW